MVAIKVSVSCVIFYVLYQYRCYVTPLFSWASNLFVLSFLSWTLGKYLTKKFVLPKLPKIPSKGKSVLVTGCDSGFGHLLALRLKKEGFHVFACCLDPEGAGAKALVCRSQGRRLTILPLDVRSEESVVKCYESVQDFLRDERNDVRELYALVNNAGIVEIRGIEMIKAPDVSDCQKLLEVNTLGLIRVTRMFLPLIRRSKGRIVNVNSITARNTTPVFATYSMTKAASVKLTEVLEGEMNRFGVKVIGIEPWVARTAMLTSGASKAVFTRAWREETSQEVKDFYGECYFDRGMASFDKLLPDGVAMEPELVVDAMMDAITSPEPDSNYRVMPSMKYDWQTWVVNELVPHDLRHSVRSFLQVLTG